MHSEPVSTAHISPADAAQPIPAETGAAPGAPLLSICVPTYHRPDLLARALRSVGPLPPEVELIVSDNSTANDDSRRVTEEVLREQPPARWHYYRNPPGGNLTSNWQDCLRRASGHFVLMLHDDDYLLPGGLAAMLAVLHEARGRYEAVQFGISVVDEHEHLLKHQDVARAEYWMPPQAVEAVLTNSSLVRMPSLVVSRAAYAEVGGPDPVQEGTNDTYLWSGVFARHGLYRAAVRTAAYSVHQGAHTAGMFNPHNVELLLRVFRRAETEQVLSPARLRRAKARFFHQFVLAGAYRSVRRRELSDARRVLSLFQEVPALRELPVPLRWLPVRLGLSLLARLG